MIRKRPVSFDDVHGAWVAAMDNFNDRKKITAHRRELLAEAEVRYEKLKVLVETAEDEGRHALALLQQARAELDAVIRELGPEAACEAMRRAYESERPR